MFALAPSTLYDSQYLRDPEVYVARPKSVSPRDRYLAALTEAQSAEAEYVAVLAREKAIQKQREEQHRRAEVQRHREEAIRKHLLLEEALYSQDSAPYFADDSHSMFPSTHRRRSHFNPFDFETEAEAALLHQLKRRRIILGRQQQEELAKRRRLAILRQQQEEREQVLALAAARDAQEVKRREQQAKLSRHSSEEEDLQQVLSLLFGGRAAVIRRQPSQEKLVHPRADPTTRRQSCGFHCAPHRQTFRNEQEDVERILKLIFGGQAEAAPHCRCAHKEETKENVAQPKCQQAVSPQRGQGQTSSPVSAPSSSFSPSLKDQLQSRLGQEPESDVRDAVQGLLSSIFGSGANVERKARVEKKNNEAAAPRAATPAGSSTSGLSLKEQLEARLYQNPRVEVHDTIQAMLASLMTEKTEAARTSVSASKDAIPRPDAPASRCSPTATAEGKGKGKEVSFDVQTVTAPTSKDVVDSMDEIHNIQAAFNALSADFSFPTRLDFTPPSSTPSSPHASDSESVSTSQLAYTSTNAPVRYYEQALSALLSQLDAVESWGNEDVRKERKEIVARVEATLEEVEREVQERLIHRQARQTREPVEVKEAKVVEKVQADEAPVSEAVEVAAVPTPVEEPATAVVVDTVEAPAATKDASAPAEQRSADTETALTIDSETSFSSSPMDENVTDHSKKITSPVNDVSVFASSVSVDESVAPPSEISGEPDELPSANLSVTSTSADKDTHGAVEKATALDHQSYPPTSQIATVYAVAEHVAEDASGTREESERVDTFLLPAATEPPVIKRPAVHDEDELVVIDKEHGEASDGENWSEVEA